MSRFKDDNKLFLLLDQQIQSPLQSISQVDQVAHKEKKLEYFQWVLDMRELDINIFLS